MTKEVKAYDAKLLLEELKNEGLEIAEESTKVLIEALFSWLEKSAVISKTPYDDMALIVLPQLKKLVLTQVENINREDNA